MSIRLVPAIIFTALLSTTAHAQSSDVSGEITLTAYSGIFQDKYNEAVIKPFLAKYPNVKVNYFPSPASSAMLGNLRSQAGDPQMDVVIFDVSTSLIGDKEGLLAPLSKTDVPSLADLVPQAIVKEGYGPAVTFDNLVVIYNIEAFPTAPTSLQVLWDKTYAGKMAVTSMPSILGSGLMVMTSAMLGEDYTKSVKQSAAKLAEMAPGVQTFDPKPDAYTLVINGTDVLGTGWNARGQYYADESKGKLGVMLPKEGTILQINTINLVQGSKNPVAAKAFIDYALSPEAQAAFTEVMFYAPVNAKAKVSEAATARTVAGKLDKTLPLDWGWAATKSDEWNQIWKRQIISAGK
ncbi:ABC transporter substrate-binding protein [Rhizobium rhizogenes]|uniref:Spermidine/putrescine ABC transporter n=1 Tax=Rhizobium rhizogenes (strain K84 / ATCC BAA-868) TaxID=311403 RepID=B9JMV1_RHIR8|nr:ABC transporter substrate-binding protein [Rhizobium rhizogenes]ACM28882.1 spermidine/putrescine ABC transporter [Rhizobium rhizogenes K84]NTI43875.1 ABC transporter substrate-binding protein [Rhizobium rhizogenes]OCJ18861.1 spermidine/putrescine ABC transporter [Agrobacterium sp. B131/95]